MMREVCVILDLYIRSIGSNMANKILRKTIDFGVKFGMLTVLEECDSRFYIDKRDGYQKRIRRVRCKCDCGNIIDRDYSSLPKQVKRGQISSCGCNNNKVKEITKDITPIDRNIKLTKQQKRDIVTDLINQGYSNKEILLKTKFSSGFVSIKRAEIGKSYFNMKYEVQVGEKHNRITIKEIIKRPGARNRVVLGECECGVIKEYRYFTLKSGKTKSCGCLGKEVSRELMVKQIKNNIKHGDRPGTKHRYIYVLWNGIKQRCYNPKNKRYKTYGLRGITMYEPWVNDYIGFKEWILNNLGERYNANTGNRSDNESLDRIDVNIGYYPGNLRWADFITQANNKIQNIIGNKTRVELIEQGEKPLQSTLLHKLYEDYYNVKVKKGYCVHHINWNSLDNSKKNLIEVSRKEHGWLHQIKNYKLKDKSRIEIQKILKDIDWDNYKG